jgi:hypothetical protein
MTSLLQRSAEKCWESHETHKYTVSRMQKSLKHVVHIVNKLSLTGKLEESEWKYVTEARCSVFGGTGRTLGRRSLTKLYQKASWHATGIIPWHTGYLRASEWGSVEIHDSAICKEKCSLSPSFKLLFWTISRTVVCSNLISLQLAVADSKNTHIISTMSPTLQKNLTFPEGNNEPKKVTIIPHASL